MQPNLRNILHRARSQLASILSGPQAIAFLPSMTLTAFWLGGEPALVVLAVVTPVLWMFVMDPDAKSDLVADSAIKGMITPDKFLARVESICTDAPEAGKTSALFVLELDGFRELQAHYEAATIDKLLKAIGGQIIAASRDRDVVSRIGDCRFGISLDAVTHMDLESCMQISNRYQNAVEEPISVDGTPFFISASVGFCMLSRAPDAGGQSWINAALAALKEAQHRSGGSVRAYSPELQARLKHRADLREDVSTALEKGEIIPWFQPQISTDTGRVTGFEALARWVHPDRGTISPAEFLPAIDAAGLSERLAEVIIFNSFTALKAWDSAGIHIPHVGVNFSGAELRNSKLVDKIRWELDRFDLTPDRLSVEILETVVTDTTDNTISRNIKSLTSLGCLIDLDDFGTGNASIAAIRRFGVGRIKIDRSLVVRADRDSEQQRMISAVLTMAERLGVGTLAEGVETVGEHALLAQLGCNHVQGFGVARPMPFEKTIDWVRAHNASLHDAPTIPRLRSR